MTAVIVCSPRGFVFRRYGRCRVCRCRRRLLVVEYGWYPSTVTCCHCGAEWDAGEAVRSHGAKRRGANRDEARRLWATAEPRATVEAQLREWLFGDVEEEPQ